MTNEKIQEIKNLTEQGKTAQEIAKILNYSLNTVRKIIYDNKFNPNTKISRKTPELLQEISDLVDEGKTNQEIADLLSMNIATVRKYIVNDLHKEYNSKRTKTLTKKNITLTDEQWEVLYGSLLGDMSLDTNWKNARPVISQGGNQEEYFEHKCEIFKGLLGKINKKNRFDKRTGKYYHKYIVKFLTNPIYTKLKEELYPNGIKTITKEWLNKLTARSIAFWFMDDGCNSGILATNCFSYEECVLIRDWFSEKWGINCTVQNQVNNGNIQHLIYIKHDSRNKFYDLVSPYFIPSMMYKLHNWNP